MADVIQLLPDSIANQIAAGEVIQRPASVVKELMENSIDAGSTQIKLIVKDAGKTLIQVIDNGCGMDERTRSKMFQAFFSTRSEGSGLGLPTVRKIMETHRGAISCDSEQGQGTRFTISLPPADENDPQDVGSDPDSRQG